MSKDTKDMLTFLGGYTLEYRGLVEVKVCFTSMALISHSAENSFNTHLFLSLIDESSARTREHVAGA